MHSDIYADVSPKNRAELDGDDPNINDDCESPSAMNSTRIQWCRMIQARFESKFRYCQRGWNGDSRFLVTHDSLDMIEYGSMLRPFYIVLLLTLTAIDAWPQTPDLFKPSIYKWTLSDGKSMEASIVSSNEDQVTMLVRTTAPMAAFNTSSKARMETLASITAGRAGQASTVTRNLGIGRRKSCLRHIRVGHRRQGHPFGQEAVCAIGV